MGGVDVVLKTKLKYKLIIIERILDRIITIEIVLENAINAERPVVHIK